jgi:DNA ligase 4
VVRRLLALKFKRQCILEGELLVWSDEKKQIEPFHKIRKHVRRAGRLLGCAEDSPADTSEHLMIVFYDLLLLDDVVCLQESHDRRRRRLWAVMRCIQDRTDIGTREKIDFKSSGASSLLGRKFASAIAQGWEGLVLKGCGDPYFSLDGNVLQIKLKKDYIGGLGDSAEFAVVGGRRDAKDEYELGMGKLSWTSFYLACLENREQVRRHDAKPKFRVIARVDRYGRVVFDNLICR